MKKQNDKEKFARFLFDQAEYESRDKHAAKDYLTSEGLDPAKLNEKALKQIMRAKTALVARQTEQEQQNSAKARQEAIAWVEELLKRQNFSLSDLVKTEELSLSFRNLETLDAEDIRETLIRHFTLKFMNKGNQEHP